MLFKKKTVSQFDYKLMYQRLFDSEEGKLVLVDLCNRFHVMRATRTPSDRQGDMEYREGQRNVMLYILSQLEYDLAKLQEVRQNNQIEVRNDV